MSASRRAQVQALCGVRSGPLIDRVESYMAAVDVWSRRGNAKAVKSAGTGVIAVCSLLAAESLDLQSPDRSSAIRASGLTPDKFATAERDFRSAVQSVSRPASAAVAGPSHSTATTFASGQRGNPSLSASRPVKSSPLASPHKGKTAASASGQQALLAKAQAVQAGSLFDQTMRAADPPTAQSKGTHSTNSERSLPDVVHHQPAPEDALPSTPVPRIARVRRPKRKRMSRLVFGLDVQPALAKDEQALEQRAMRLRRDRIQAVVNHLGTVQNPAWRYHDFPRDFVISISRDAP